MTEREEERKLHDAVEKFADNNWFLNIPGVRSIRAALRRPFKEAKKK